MNFLAKIRNQVAVFVFVLRFPPPPRTRIFAQAFAIELKKKNRKKLFSPYKIIDSEIFIKVSQNPNKVVARDTQAGDTQGLPTVPHNDFGGLNFKGLTSKYPLLMTLPPADVTKK